LRFRNGISGREIVVRAPHSGAPLWCAVAPVDA
jgi:hypothetical protein